MKIKRKKKRGKPLTRDEKGMLAAYDKSVDFTKKEYIVDIVSSGTFPELQNRSQVFSRGPCISLTRYPLTSGVWLS